tara:strand:+ start:1083 stop:1601 length:519 start_codon:yes stop_codon:yes gene_type:complete
MLTGLLPDTVNFIEYVENGSLLHGNIPLAQFSRLCELIEDDEGSVEVSLTFRQEESQRVTAVGTAMTELKLACQSCLEVMSLPVAIQIDVTLVNDENELAALPSDSDGIVVEAPMVSLTDIIEDDLILVLPMVPRHEEPCWEVQGSDVETGSVQETHRPFAKLSELIEKEAE